MNHETVLLTILNGGAALLGLYFLVRAFRAYHRHGSRHLLVLAVGVGLLTLALLVEGFVFRILDWPLADAHVLEASVGLVAFAVLVYSLHA